MNKHKLAQGLASLGRGEDSMLVHMTPREVAGLQKIAMDHGGSLTVNPHTGLVEAGFLKSILPALAGIGLSFIPGIGPLAAGALSGAVTGVATKDWKQGLLAALSAGAASGATRGLAGLGDWTTKELGKTALTEEGAKSLTRQGLSNLGREAAQAGAKSYLGSIGAGAGQLLGGGAGTTAGMTALGGKLGLGALAAPMLYEATKPPKYKMPGETKEGKFKYMKVKYNPGVYNPNAGFGEAPFVGQGYGDEQYYDTYPGYAEGGEVAPPVTAITDYVNQLNQSFKPRAPAAPVAPVTPPPSTAPTTPVVPGLPAGFDPSKIDFSKIGSFMGINFANLMGGAGGAGTYKYDPATQQFTNPGFNPANIPGVVNATAPSTSTAYTYNPAVQQFIASQSKERGKRTNKYAAGGRLLSGGGDGMSDSIPAMIDGAKQQPARLADGEFVVPADVVSHLGNGSTKAGADQLYAMMDKVRTARTGRAKQAPAIKPEKYLA